MLGHFRPVCVNRISMKRFAIGTVGTFTVMYLAWAFVSADLYWLRDVMSWSSTDRAGLLYWLVLCCVGGAAASK